LDALVCGACVGLGFALAENINYIDGGSMGVALSRFLTANFLHISMTALTSSALYDLFAERHHSFDDFSRTLMLVVLGHGAYDFFIVNPQVHEVSFLAMTIFIVLTQQFLRLVDGV